MGHSGTFAIEEEVQWTQIFDVWQIRIVTYDNPNNKSWWKNLSEVCWLRRRLRVHLCPAIVSRDGGGSQAGRRA